MGLQQRGERSQRWWPDLGWLDWIGFGLLSVVILALCVVKSRSRLFWSDELLGYTLLRDPSLARTLHGWWEGADGGGLLYYVTGWLWFRLFGASPLVLRLLSTTGFLAGIGVIWVMARRFFSTTIVAVAMSAVFLLPPYLVWQELNGRFYGLFLASAAFAAACTMAAVEAPGSSVLLLVLMCCSHACLVGSHLLGVVYSASLLIALVTSDLLQGRRRPVLYSCVLLAWALILPVSFHAMLASSGIAQGVFWTLRPHKRELLFGFFAYSHKLLAAAVVLLLVIAIRRSSGLLRLYAENARSYRSIAVVVAGLVLGQLVLFAKSQVGLSIYSDRYLLPLTIALVLVLCLGMTLALGSWGNALLARPAVAVVVLLASVSCGAYAARRADPYGQLYAARDYPEKVERLLPPGEDVVITYLPTFMMLQTLDATHRYIFATDWGFDGGREGVDLSGQRLMENLDHGGYATHRVLELPAIVRELPEFTLIAEPDRLPWLHQRFSEAGGFKVKEVGVLEDWYPITIWQVRCVHPTSGCVLGMPPEKSVR